MSFSTVRTVNVLVMGLVLLSGSWLFAQTATSTSAPSGKEAILFDFEPGGKIKFEGAEKLEFVAEHATEGKHSGKISLDQDKFFNMYFEFKNGQNMGGRWGEYDRFVMDVFVDGGAVKASGQIRDAEGNTFDVRYNYQMVLAPGKRTIEIPTGAILREKGHKPLDLAKLTSMGMRIAVEDKSKPATIYIDNARLVKGGGSFEIKRLFSFEGNDEGKYILEDWPPEMKGKSKMSEAKEHASDGAKSLFFESGSTNGNVQFTPAVTDWSAYDTLAFDVFNPSDKPLRASGWVKANPTDPMDKRYCWDRMVRPGQSTLKIAIGGMTDPKGKTTISSAKIDSFNISVDTAALYVDNVRLIRGSEEIPVEGMKKFDFGPKGGAVMPGFKAVSKEDAYSAETGFGWLKGGSFWRDFDISEGLGRYRPCDDLCRDFCSPIAASFVVDLPNGDYRCWVMLDPMGASIWHRTFKKRTVTAQGKVVIDQDYADTAKLLAHVLRWQDSEDLPGDDLWEKYVNSAYVPVTFDANVSDGKLKLDFDGHDEAWAVQLAGLVIWPKAQETQAQKWLANLADMRKEQFQAQMVESPPPAQTQPAEASDADKAKGYVRFVHLIDRKVNVNSVPTSEEIKTAGIELAGAPGTFEDGCFGIFPLKDCGVMTAEVTALTGPKGATIPAGNVDLQVVRYKAQNQISTYTVMPKYLDRLTKEGIAIRPGVTRSFWLIVKIPQDAAIGKYKGQVNIASTGGGKDTIDVELNVMPIRLSEINIPLGMYMVAPPPIIEDESSPEYWALWKEVLQDCRDHGMTSLDPKISVPLKSIKDGKAEVDFSVMDKFMEMAKAAGFQKELCGYAIHTGFKMRPDALKGNDAQRFGVKTYGEVVKAYFAAVGEHAKAKDWLPIAWGSDDETLIHPGGTPELVGEYHRILKENAPGVRFVAADSINPDAKPELIPAYEKMLPLVDTFATNIHSPKAVELFKKTGSRMWLYNTGRERYTFGTYMFYATHKYDVQGFFQWIYFSGGTLGCFDLMGYKEADFGVVVPSSRGLRTTPPWERFRAGCNDHRYLQTAWDLIAAAKKSGKNVQAAEALQGEIDKVFGKLTFGKKGNDAKDGDGPLTPEGMASFRKTLAEGILKLQAQ